MPRRVLGSWAAAALAVVTACGGGSSRPAAPSAPTPSGAALPRVVLVTHATGFRHGSIDAAERVVPGLARDAGIATLDIARTADDVRRLLAPAALATIAGVVFVNTTGDPGVPDLPALLAWIAAGHGFVGVHSASDTYHDRPEYLAMLGNEFQEHGEQAAVEAVVEMPAHPAVAHLGPRYRVFDEIYRFTANNRGSVIPLLTLDRHPLDGRARAGEPGDLPLAWAKPHGRGRVFYTALGHRDELWADATFQQHVLGGLRWALQR
jgi:type 1 glutamine amidotransferase